MGISLVTYSGETVTADDDALVYSAACRKSGLIYGGTVTLSSANVLHIAAGHGIIAGRKFTIEAANISVSLSSSDTILGRLYVHLDLSNTSTPISLLTETGASLTDPVQESDVNVNDGVWEFNIAEFNVSTSTISDLENVAPTFTASSQTLSAGSTSVTFDVPTYGDYLIDFYTSTGINYQEIDTSTEGEVTLTFEEQESDVTVYCDTREV